MGTEAQPRPRRVQPGSRRRARRLAVAYVVAMVAALATACSLFIPFDDYRGSGAGADAADVADTAVADAGADAEDNSCDASDKETDPNNCGGCGHVCVEGPGSCEAGRCPITPLFEGDAASIVQALTVAPLDAGAGGYLYISSAGPFVARRSLGSGVIETGPTPAGGGVRALSVNEDASLGVAAVGVKTIETFDPADFADRPLQVLSGNHVGLAPLLITGDSFFWGDSQGPWWSVTTPDAAAGGGPEAGTAPPVAFVEVGGLVLWVTSNGAVYSTSAKAPGTVMPVLLGGGAATFADIAASNKYLYLCQRTSVGGGLIVYLRANLAAPLRTIAMGDPESVVTDGDYVYVVDFRNKGGIDARVVRLKADGTQLVTLADPLRSSRGLAIDGPWVYFADGPRVLRTSK